MSNLRRLDEYRALAQRAMVGSDRALSPWPAVDRYPNIIGSGLTLQYISAVMRLCLTGYRQQYVDLAEELLVLDPHCFSNVQKRVLAIGQGKVEFVPPKDEDIPDEGERAIAKEVASWVQSEVNQIPDFTAALTQLAWGLYYSVATVEKMLVRRDDRSIGISSLEFVHYRRLSYPDPWKWDLYVWDQGLVQAPTSRMMPTQGVYGLNIETVRDKYIVHIPQVCGSYPTRDGLARELVYWMAIKHIASRLAPQYLERFAIPFADVEYSTKGSIEGSNGEPSNLPRMASDEDQAIAIQAARNIGAGALGYFVHPDSIRLVFGKPEGAPALTFSEWNNLCNSEMSKATSGGTLTTDAGERGARSLGDTQKKGEEKLYNYDATRMASTLKRDVGDFLVRNNPRYQSLPARLFPLCVVHVNDDPDPTDVIDRAGKGATAGMPVDADAIAKQTNLPLVPNPNPGKPRRMVPVLPVKLTVSNEELGFEPAPPPPAPPPLAPGAPHAPPAPGERPTPIVEEGAEPEPKKSPTKGE